MSNRKRPPVVVFMIPLYFGLLGFYRVTQSPQFESYRTMDVVAASIILPARATPPSGVSVTPLAPVAQFNEINANATDGGNGLPVITNLPTATNPDTNFSTGGQKFCRLSQ